MLADAVFEGVETVLVTDVVLVEAVWTLIGRKYSLSRGDLIAAMERLFSEPNVRFEDDQAVWRSLQAYRNSLVGGVPTKEIGFADALIVYKAQRVAAGAGETLNNVYTFDKAMQQLPGVASP